MQDPNMMIYVAGAAVVIASIVVLVVFGACLAASALKVTAFNAIQLA